MQTDRNWLEAIPDDSRRYGVYRNPGAERMFCRYVTEGAVSEIRRIFDSYSFPELIGREPLSDDPVMNLKYHFVEVAFMLSRACIENGLPMEEANDLSCSYVQQMDRLTAWSGVKQLLDRLVLDFTERMLARKKLSASSRQTAEAIDYIYAHIFERITVEDMARAIKVSPSYLSRIFKRELGIAVSDYIRAEKVEMAKGLLQYTDYPQVDISNKLAYSSQSHFIQQFHKMTGMTPKAYRSRHRVSGFREPD